MQYLDLNYVLGQGSSGETGYDSPDAILKQMDYLDIDRALVFSAAARDWSGINANLELLKKLEPYSQRLFPVFVITPRDYYETGTLECYRELCAAGKVRAFRIIPGKSRSPLYECEFVLEALSEFDIVVQIDTRELTIADYQTLAQLARQFPSITFVLGQKIWCDQDVLFNLMKRCSNVMADTSWLHVRNIIELAVKHFGAERLLFATGHRAQFGAAIGALNHARLTPEQRELIAHGNAERLLHLAPLTRKLAVPPAILQEKPLWQKLARGEKIENVEIIDAHTHQAGPAASGYLLDDSNIEQSLPGMIEVMDKLGISRSIVISSKALHADTLNANREFAEYAQSYRNRISGYWSFNPHLLGNITQQTLEQEFADGFYVGFKILPGYWGLALDDPGFKPMWQFAEKHNLPVLIHTWNDVEPLGKVIPDYPAVNFIIAHAGGGAWGREEAIKLVEKYPNVYLETCGTFCTDWPLNEVIEKIGTDRFIFGTDAALHDAAYEMSALLSMPIPDAKILPILADNIKKLITFK